MVVALIKHLGGAKVGVPRSRLNGMRPLLWLRRSLLLGRGNEIWQTDAGLGSPRLVARIPVARGIEFLSSLRLFARVFRTGLHAAQRVDDRFVLVAARDSIWRVDLSDGSVTLDFTIPDKRRVLFLTRLGDDCGGIAPIAFGEYFDNPERLPVRIWRRRATVEPIWEATHVFPEGCINHVHNICPGQAGRVWILTGDFGQSAAIWRCSDDLSSPTVEFGGRQSYRATWLHESANSGLTWATDTQLEPNHLMHASREADGWKVRSVAPIDGSCIYWQKVRDGMVFSSSVEPGEPTGHLLRDVFCRQRGSGILSDDAVLYHYGERSGLRSIARGSKDFWPFRLAQFGCFVLAAGVGPDEVIVCGGQALTGLDGRTLLYPLANDAS